MDCQADVAVIFVNWNTKDLLDRSLGELKAFLGSLRAQVVVIDNASNDGSAEHIRRHHPAVHLIANSQNEGFAKAVNRGIQATGAPLVLVLNPAALPYPGAIQSMVDLMRADPAIGIVGPRLVGVNGRLHNSVANHPSLATELLHKPLMSRLLPGRFYSRHFQPSVPACVDSIVGACMLLRRSMLQKIGVFDEDFFLFMEETDLCLRAQQAGWKVVFHPHARALHHQGASATQAGARARIEYWRSRSVYFRKHRSPRCCVILAGMLVVRKLLNIIYFALLGLLSGGARAKLHTEYTLLAWNLLGQPEGWGLQPAPHVQHANPAPDHAYRSNEQGVLSPVRRS